MLPTMLGRKPLIPPTILVVEDSPDDAMVVGLTFQEAGIGNPLAFVEDGQQAVEYLRGVGEYADREAWPLPMLMILDLNLPKLTGHEVLAQTGDIVDEHGIVVVVLSVSDDPKEGQRSRKLGARHVLQKPIDPGTLLTLISEIEDFKLLIVRGS